MSDWKSTHRTKPGVEVEISKESGIYRVRVLNDGLSTGNVFTEIECKALFEPIPKPVVVELPLETAKRLFQFKPLDTSEWNGLGNAIRAAEQEQTQ